jgi:hypothetical protein
MLKESIYLITEYELFSFPIQLHELEQIFTDKGIETLLSKHIKKPFVICESISIPYYCSSKEYRSSLCHEAAHFLFHDTNSFFKSEIINIKNEAQANAFAAYFLMPVYIFEESFRYCSNDYELAEEFGVTEELVRFRKKLTQALIYDGYFINNNFEEENENEKNAV